MPLCSEYLWESNACCIPVCTHHLGRRALGFVPMYVSAWCQEVPVVPVVWWCLCDGRGQPAAKVREMHFTRVSQNTTARREVQGSCHMGLLTLQSPAAFKEFTAPALNTDQFRERFRHIAVSVALVAWSSTVSCVTFPSVPGNRFNTSPSS